MSHHSKESAAEPSRFLHYVRRTDVLKSSVYDEYVTALCGLCGQFSSLTGGGAGGGSSEVCPTCELFFAALAVEPCKQAVA